MVAGHLQEKNGIYYVVLTYKTYDGKRKTKWQSTGLPIKGNKRRAEAMVTYILYTMHLSVSFLVW